MLLEGGAVPLVRELHPLETRGQVQVTLVRVGSGVSSANRVQVAVALYLQALGQLRSALLEVHLRHAHVRPETIRRRSMNAPRILWGESFFITRNSAVSARTRSCRRVRLIRRSVSLSRFRIRPGSSLRSSSRFSLGWPDSRPWAPRTRVSCE